MNKKFSKTLKIIFFSLVALATVYAIEKTPVTKKDVKDLNPSQILSGILKISGPEEVAVNGNKAPDGTTILSNSNIKTPASTEAQVILNKLGSVEIGCGSTAVVTFTENQIQVNMVNGYARLVTNQGINGTLTLTNNEILRTTTSLPTSFVESANVKPGCSAVGAVIIARPEGVSLGSTLGLAGAVIGGATFVSALVSAGGGPPLTAIVTPQVTPAPNATPTATPTATPATTPTPTTTPVSTPTPAPTPTATPTPDSAAPTPTPTPVASAVRPG